MASKIVNLFISPRYNVGERVANGKLVIYSDNSEQRTLVPLYCYADLKINPDDGTGIISNPVPVDGNGILASPIFFDHGEFPSAWYEVLDQNNAIIRSGFVMPQSWQMSGDPGGGGIDPGPGVAEGWPEGDRYWGYEVVSNVSQRGNIGRPLFTLPGSNGDASGGLIVWFQPNQMGVDNVITFNGEGGIWKAREQWLNYSYLNSRIPNGREVFEWLESNYQGQYNVILDMVPPFRPGPNNVTFSGKVRMVRDIAATGITQPNTQFANVITIPDGNSLDLGYHTTFVSGMPTIFFNVKSGSFNSSGAFARLTQTDTFVNIVKGAVDGLFLDTPSTSRYIMTDIAIDKLSGAPQSFNLGQWTMNNSRVLSTYISIFQAGLLSSALDALGLMTLFIDTAYDLQLVSNIRYKVKATGSYKLNLIGAGYNNNRSFYVEPSEDIRVGDNAWHAVNAEFYNKCTFASSIGPKMSQTWDTDDPSFVKTNPLIVLRDTAGTIQMNADNSAKLYLNNKSINVVSNEYRYTVFVQEAGQLQNCTTVCSLSYQNLALLTDAGIDKTTYPWTQRGMRNNFSFKQLGGYVVIGYSFGRATSYKTPCIFSNTEIEKASVYLTRPTFLRAHSVIKDCDINVLTDPNQLPTNAWVYHIGGQTTSDRYNCAVVMCNNSGLFNNRLRGVSIALDMKRLAQWRFNVDTRQDDVLWVSAKDGAQANANGRRAVLKNIAIEGNEGDWLPGIPHLRSNLGRYSGFYAFDIDDASPWAAHCNGSHRWIDDSIKIYAYPVVAEYDNVSFKANKNFAVTLQIATDGWQEDGWVTTNMGGPNWRDSLIGWDTTQLPTNRGQSIIYDGFPLYRNEWNNGMGLSGTDTMVDYVPYKGAIEIRGNSNCNIFNDGKRAGQDDIEPSRCTAEFSPDVTSRANPESRGLWNGIWSDSGIGVDRFTFCMASFNDRPTYASNDRMYSFKKTIWNGRRIAGIDGIVNSPGSWMSLARSIQLYNLHNLDELPGSRNPVNNAFFNVVFAQTPGPVAINGNANQSNASSNQYISSIPDDHMIWPSNDIEDPYFSFGKGFYPESLMNESAFGNGYEMPAQDMASRTPMSTWDTAYNYYYCTGKYIVMWYYPDAKGRSLGYVPQPDNMNGWKCLFYMAQLPAIPYGIIWSGTGRDTCCVIPRAGFMGDRTMQDYFDPVAQWVKIR